MSALYDDFIRLGAMALESYCLRVMSANPCNVLTNFISCFAHVGTTREGVGEQREEGKEAESLEGGCQQ